MKTILFCLLIVFSMPFSFASQADPIHYDSLSGYRMGACTSWRFADSSMPGYLCSNAPSTVTVADAYSYANAIRQLEARIAELEKKVAELQPPASPQPK